MDFGRKAGDLSRWFEIEGDKRKLASDSVVRQSDELRVAEAAKRSEQPARLIAA